MKQPAASLKSPVRRRRVHYFSGFDPRGAAWYHRLFRDEAAKPQPQGGVVRVGRREKLSQRLSRWFVQWRADADAPVSVETEHVFMGWDDVIRAHWSRSPWALVREFFSTYRGILFDVNLARVRRLSPTAFITGVYPAVYLLGSILICLLAGWGLGWGVAALAGLGSSVAAWGLLPALAGLVWWWRRGERLGLFWLMRIFHFIIRMGRGPIAGLEACQQDWVQDIIRRQQEDPVDEVLLVGHSVGVLVMVDAVDALLQDARWQALQQGRTTCMLTLGQCYPFVALVPAATGFRAALQRLSHHPGLIWWDVTARIDPLCFYNVHPLDLSATPQPGASMPRRHDARFYRMYEAGHWSDIRGNKLQTHFLYLKTADKAGNFHLYDVLYGPHPLRQYMKAVH